MVFVRFGQQSTLQYFFTMDFSQQMTIIRQSMWAHSIKKQHKVKTISPQKWRAMMRKCLEKFKTKGIFDCNMIDDLETIIKKIPEDKFVEATLNLQPFKPIFSQTARKHRESKTKSSSEEDLSEQEDTQMTRTKFEESPRFKGSIIKFKHTVTQKITSDWQTKSQRQQRKSLLQVMLTLVTEQLTLVRQFQAKYHPFRKIMEGFLFVLENKYKMMIQAQETVDVQQIQEKLIIDLRLFQEFIVKSSEPYLQLFKTENYEEQEIFRIKLIAFINQYIDRHEKVNMTIRKILRAACRKSKLIKALTQKLPDFATINEFDVPKEYQIDGCYAHAMTTLVSLVDCTSSRSCLKKLKELRFSLGKDIDLYYKQQQKQFELSAQTQLQIMKFLVAKLKAFLCQIYSQLKYLEVVCGEEDMSYKFDDSSYMYAQLSVAFEALELDHQ